MAEGTSATDPASLFGAITPLDILAIVVIIAVSVMVAKVVTIYLKKSLSGRMKREELDLLVRVVSYFIILIGLLAASTHLNLDISGILVAGGVIGVIIGFASQSIVSNLISGIFIIIERPVKIGDSIRIGDVSGVIEEIKILSTTLMTFDGVYVRIPNEKIFTSNITNYVAHPGRRIEYSIGIGYSSDAAQAIALITSRLEDEPFVLKEPVPDVYVERLGENSVVLSVWFWAPSEEWFTMKKKMLQELRMLLSTSGIEINFPQRVVWMQGAQRPDGD